MTSGQIDHRRLLAAPAFERPYAYTARDAALHALAIGFGMEPSDPGIQRFVCDDATEFQAFPTMSAVLGWVDMFRDRAAVDPSWGLRADSMVVGALALKVLAPLPVAGAGVARSRFVEAVDKGHGRPALLRVRKETFDGAGRMLATLDTWALVRKGGGFGGPPDGGPERSAVPEREPDAVCALATPPNLALLYRLSLGDRNALHADPAHARQAGFDKPILHGLASFSIAVRAALQTFARLETGRFEGGGARMTAPVVPGDTLLTEFWLVGNTIRFRTTATERNALVMDSGHVALASDR